MRKSHASRTNYERPRKSRYDRGLYEGHKYVFVKNLDGSDNEEEDIELLSVKPKPREKENFIEKMVEKGDTLQMLALKFNCTIADLKRINNIHRDNEIHAHQIIKIPIQEYSLLTEEIPSVHTSRSSSADRKTGTEFCDDLVVLEVNEHAGTVKSSPVKQYLKSKDQDIARICESTVVNRTLPEEAVDSEDECFQTVPEIRQKSCVGQGCSGADWGIQWGQLLVCSLLLGFIGPIVYVLYLTEDAQLHVNNDELNVTNITST